MKPPCAVDGCSALMHARGLCATHYQRLRKTGTTQQPAPRQKAACDVAGCDRQAKARRLCFLHYHRKAKHGSEHWTPPTFERKFWARVDKSKECWIWVGQRMTTGYGAFGSRRGNLKHEFTTRAAHRISWILAFGEIPDGLFVCHKCDVPACVRPDHLFLGTHLDNMRDMINKGRDRKNPNRGEAHHQAKLAEDDVLTIRKLSRSGASRNELADRFGVIANTITKIVSRQIWTHI